MPQFDFVSFFVQIFWFSLSAFAFYLIYLINYSKNIAEIFKIRSKINSFADVMKHKIQLSDLYNQVMKSVKRR
jgi:hypothetical protein